MKHPTQKIVNGRFVENKIVVYLLDNGVIDMNELAILPFDAEDRQQFAQLIGYSLSGYGQLNYVTDASYDKAQTLQENPHYTDSQTEIKVLNETLSETRGLVKKLATSLFRIHEDDLVE